MPGLKNLERRLLRVERQLAPPVEIKLRVTLLRAALNQMDHAELQLLSKLKGLTHEQIRRQVADDYEIRAWARRTIGFVMRPKEQDVAGEISKAIANPLNATRFGLRQELRPRGTR